MPSHGLYRDPAAHPLTPAYVRFSDAVCRINDRGEYPTPGAIERELGRFTSNRAKTRGKQAHNLNGREAKWRTHLMLVLGYEHHPEAGRRKWYRPEEWDPSLIVGHRRGGRAVVYTLENGLSYWHVRDDGPKFAARRRRAVKVA